MSQSDPAASDSSQEQHESEVVTTRNARYGLRLFGVYVLLYGTFMGLNVWKPQWMAAIVGGVNIAIWYGLGLIVAALVLAAFYVHKCRVVNPPQEKDGA